MNIEPVREEVPGEDVTRAGGMRRVLRILLRSFLAVFLLLVVLYLLRGSLLAGPLARLVARQLGDDVTIERIEGTWFTNVQVIGFESPELRFARAAADYSLLGLLGDRPQDAIRSISVVGLDLDVDLTKPSEESDAPFRPFEFLPEKFPRFKVRGKLRLRTEWGEVCSGVEVTGGGKSLDLILTDLKLPDLPDTPRFKAHIERGDAEFDGLRRIDPQADLHVWVRPDRRLGGYEIS